MKKLSITLPLIFLTGFLSSFCLAEKKEGMVKLDAAAQQRGGIEVAPLKACAHADELTARALVVKTDELPDACRQCLKNCAMKPQDLLLQVWIPLDAPAFTPAASAKIRSTNGTLVPIQFLAEAPPSEFEPNEKSFFYAVADNPKILPWVSLTAYLPTGPEISGVEIPASAVVWWDGKAWAYLKQGADTFARREVPTGISVNDGWFVAKEFNAGDNIVVKGAQLLLSEEFRGQFQLEEE